MIRNRTFRGSHPRSSCNKTRVLLGQPVEKIIEYADEEKVDMIVIGSIGLSGISRLKPLGSVSRGIVERARDGPSL